MGYRIRYERCRRPWVPAAAGVILVLVLLFAAPEEGWYLALARLVGGMIRGAH